MPKRKLTIEQLRELVRARRTKGSAFMLNSTDYDMLQDVVKTSLAAMSYDEIKAEFPEYTYDVL